MNLSVRFSSAKNKTHAIATAIACGALVLPSCQIPKLRVAEPGPGVPGVYNGAPPAPPDYNPLSEERGPVLPAGFEGPPTAENSAQLGVEEFYNDPILTGLIQQALAGNRELKVLEQEVQIARNEILARQGAYLPFVGLRAGVGLDKPSLYTPEGAVEHQLDVLPFRQFPDPLGNFMGSLSFLWHPDIFRALRNARDAAQQRYVAANERRNSFVSRLIAETAENYYGLMALDQRLAILDQTIANQQLALDQAQRKLEFGRGTLLGVQRFQADVRKNQSEKLIVKQEIVEVENHINFLVNRFPQPVERASAGYYDLDIHALSVGVPSQLLLNRPDVRQAERELVAAGLDVKVARSHFFPDVNITGAVGYEAFNPKYLFVTPEALIYGVAGELVAPLINKKAIQAEYLSANAKQLESVYNYQRVILNAFTEVITRVSMAENYRKSIELKKQQLAALEAAVESANRLFLGNRVEYVEVLLVLRDVLDARTVLIQTKRQQLSAIVSAYQALGGGGNLFPTPAPQPPQTHRRWFHPPVIPAAP